MTLILQHQSKHCIGFEKVSVYYIGILLPSTLSAAVREIHCYALGI